MKIRDYRMEDLGALVEMHRTMGMTYPFPELHNAAGEENPLFIRKMILEHDGKPVMALLARITCEGFLLQDVTVEPRARWDRFRALQEVMFERLYRAGLEDVHVFLPPDLDKPFGKRLVSTGWVSEPWPAYCKFLEAPRTEAKDGPCG